MDKRDLTDLVNSLKGISGTGNVLGQLVKNVSDMVMTMEPGDYVQGNTVMTAPTSYDLWYLWANANMLANYYTHTNVENKYFDYSVYLAENLSFLTRLTGLKPLKYLSDLKHDLQADISENVFGELLSAEYHNNGIYWINTLAFELWNKGKGMQYPSNGSVNYKVNPNDYIGYLTFPVGQLGVMEVISLLQETMISGYQLANIDPNSTTVLQKLPPVIENKDKPSLQSTPLMFPDMKNSVMGSLAGKNYCYGRHMIEFGYLKPTTPIVPQNTLSSEGTPAYAPTPSKDVELFSEVMPITKEGFPGYEDVKPKFWMRYWIHKEDTFPVPGEFIGVLCRPVACPPHVWWFQESSPFIYAGNWIETNNLTSGVITAITLAKDRTDYLTPRVGSQYLGDQYTVKIQGCEVLIESVDFYNYSVGDRVAILKVDSTLVDKTLPVSNKSFTWINQIALKDTNKLKILVNRVIIPFTFFKTVH